MKDQQTTINKTKWTTVLILTVLMSFCIELFFVGYAIFSQSTYSSRELPSTLHWVWEILALLLIYIALNKLKVHIGLFALVLFFGLVISSAVLYFIPDSLKLIKANYYGIVIRETPEASLTPSLLFKSNDPELKSELKESSRENAYVSTKGFLFWQTGLSYGFLPDKIKEYNGGETFTNHIELFFTVGPMVLVDCLITGIYTNFLILLLFQTIYFLFKKEHFWDWDV